MDREDISREDYEKAIWQCCCCAHAIHQRAAAGFADRHAHSLTERRRTMKHYENLEEAMCMELEKLDKKYGVEHAEMTVQDVEKADLLYHALKSAATYHAMKDQEGWEEKDESGRSYRRGRDSMGRYTSRDMGGEYSGGYGYSGRYPKWMPPMYPRY